MLIDSLTTVCFRRVVVRHQVGSKLRRKAIDQLRRAENWKRKHAEVLRLSELDHWAEEPEDADADKTTTEKDDKK